MLALWWLGAPVELALGRVALPRLYMVSGLAGSAGALLADAGRGHRRRLGRDLRDPRRGLILEWQATGSLARQAT